MLCFFVVACGNKEDAKINKEEVLQKSAEAYKNIKSADMLINLKMEPKKSGQPMELTIGRLYYIRTYCYENVYGY